MSANITRIIAFVTVLAALSACSRPGDAAEAIRAFLRDHIEKENAGVAIGIVDESGSRVIGCGKLGNGTDQEVNGDTVFEIGSVGKTFTTLLLQDVIERRHMQLDDPVAKHLPGSVRMPARNGKQITLRQLATHYSGLPGVPDNLDAKRADNPYADYTVEKLYAFLAGYALTRDPGAQSEYSNLGMGLLGHVIALKARSDYETLAIERICRPLKMDSTRVELTQELKARCVTGHNQFGEPVPNWDVPILAGAGALRSTANDLLKYAAANLGLTPSHLTPLMKQTRDKGLAWHAEDYRGRKIVGHSGGTAGCSAYVGLDEARHRGVVILSNRRAIIDVDALGSHLLKNGWSALPKIPSGVVKFPKAAGPRVAIKLKTEQLDARAGEYEFAPNAAKEIPGGMKVRVWREDNQLVAEAQGKGVLQGRFEIYPESESAFFDRISDTRTIFRKNAEGEVVAMALQREGQAIAEGKRIIRSATSDPVRR